MRMCSLLLAAPVLAQAAWMPVTLVNNSGLPDHQVYVLVKALDPASGKDCFLKLDTQTGQGQCEPVTSHTASAAYSYTLAELDGITTLQFPQMYSGRIYVSVGYPVHLTVGQDGKIIDTDGFKPRDVNYYTLHDKIEFSYNEYGTWINPTAVDFFSLPLRIEQPGAATELKAAGLSAGFTDIYRTLHDEVARFDTTLNHEWDKLFIYFEADGQAVTPLRFMSPGKAMVQNMADTRPFDVHYLNDANRYGMDYIDTLWQYYETHTVQIDASELRAFFPLDDYLFTGHVEGDTFVFINQTGTYEERIQKPKTSMPFFAGAGDEFDHVNNTPKAIIVRQISSAFVVGLLPAPDGTVLDKHYFESQRDSHQYYTANPQLPVTEQGPWYDLYGKALHAFGSEQPIYTFAYDDALGQDGTLHDPNASNISPVTITLGNMQGVTIPDPFTDDTTYTVTVYIGENSKVIYHDRALKSGDSLTDVTMPLSVTLNGEAADIYLKYPMVTPFFEGADGIVIDKTGVDSANVIFPGKP